MFNVSLLFHTFSLSLRPVRAIKSYYYDNFLSTRFDQSKMSTVIKKRFEYGNSRIFRQWKKINVEKNHRFRYIQQARLKNIEETTFFSVSVFFMVHRVRLPQKILVYGSGVYQGARKSADVKKLDRYAYLKRLWKLE